MPDDLLRIPFEFFVRVVWDRYGPVAGLLVAGMFLAGLIGLILLAFAFGPQIAEFLSASIRVPRQSAS